MGVWQRVEHFSKAAIFVVRERLLGCEISRTPALDQEALAAFTAALEKTAVYLEYGSGGSTLTASRVVHKLVSVESDPVFGRAVVNAIPADARAEVAVLRPDIGLTHAWGFPVFGRPTPSRIEKWKTYPKAPWPVLRETVPDTILIDGRFRVACALESLLHVGRDTRMLVDDYLGRNYRNIESFADLVAMHGRMAEFRKSSRFDAAACRSCLETAYADAW